MRLQLPVKDPLVVVLVAQVVVMVGALAFMAGRAGHVAAPAPVAAAPEPQADEDPLELPTVEPPHAVEAPHPPPPMPEPAKLTDDEPTAAKDFAAWPAGEASPPPLAESAKVAEAGPPGIEALLKSLTEGNSRSVEGVMRQRDVVSLRRQFEHGERAEAVVVTCTDSRVVPELVFDQPAGTFSVLRLPAAQLDDAAVRAVDEAVKRLKVKSVLVMGHAGCSHVDKALAKAGPRRVARPSSLPAALGGLSQLEGSARDEAASAAAISFATWELRRRSKVLRGADVTVLRVLYRPSTGDVRWLDGEDEPAAGPAPVGRAPKGH